MQRNHEAVGVVRAPASTRNLLHDRVDNRVSSKLFYTLSLRPDLGLFELFLGNYLEGPFLKQRILDHE